MSEAPLIWALDISKSKTGFVEGRAGETPRASSIVGAGMEDVKVMTKLFCFLRDRSKLGKPDWIFYEAPLGGGVSRPEIDWENREWHYNRSPKTAVTLHKMCA